MFEKETQSPVSSFCFSVRPRFGEFDAGGVLYHANYFHLYETGREALLEFGSTPYTALVAAGRHLAVTESHQQFLGPVIYGAALPAKLWVSELRGASCKINYEFFEPDETTVLHRAWTRHVLVELSAEGFRPRPLPKELRLLLERHLASEPKIGRK